MKLKICALALAVLPLTLAVGCDKKAADPAPVADEPKTDATTPADGTEVKADGADVKAETTDVKTDVKAEEKK